MRVGDGRWAMKELKGSERKRLRAMAHGLEPVCYVGKNGLTAVFLDSVRVALAHHELIKVKFVDARLRARKEERKEWSERIAAETDSNLVGLIGNIAILYREQPDEERRKISLESGVRSPEEEQR